MVQLQRHGQEAKPDENVAPCQPDQVDDQEARPEEIEQAERQQVCRREEESCGRRVGERAHRAQRRNVRVQRRNGPIGIRVEADEAVEALGRRHDQQKPGEEQVTGDGHAHEGRLAIEAKAGSKGRETDHRCRHHAASARVDGNPLHGAVSPRAGSPSVARDGAGSSAGASFSTRPRNRHNPTSGANRLTARTGHVIEAAA